MSKYSPEKTLAIAMAISIMIHAAAIWLFSSLPEPEKKEKPVFRVSYAKKAPAVKTADKTVKKQPSKPKSAPNKISRPKLQKIPPKPPKRPLKRPAQSKIWTPEKKPLPPPHPKPAVLKETPPLAQTEQSPDEDGKDFKPGEIILPDPGPSKSESSESTETGKDDQGKTDENGDRPKKEPIQAGGNMLCVLSLRNEEATVEKALEQYEEEYGKAGKEERDKAALIQFKIKIGDNGTPEIIEFTTKTGNEEIDETIKGMLVLMTFEKKTEEEVYLPILIFAESEKPAKKTIRIERKGDFKAKTIEIPHRD